MAIDFGTTLSGYAFKVDEKDDAIHMNINWGSESGASSYKTPTSVLTRKDGNKHTFMKFGYEAQEEYSKDSGREMCLFDKFKMELHTDDRAVSMHILTNT